MLRSAEVLRLWTETQSQEQFILDGPTAETRLKPDLKFVTYSFKERLKLILYIFN
jgi:hypothetical protein